MGAKYKVVYGVKLFERKCSQCSLTFLVPASSPQVTCGEYCTDKATKVKEGFKRYKRRKSVYKIQESDYES